MNQVLTSSGIVVHVEIYLARIYRNEWRVHSKWNYFVCCDKWVFRVYELVWKNIHNCNFFYFCIHSKWDDSSKSNLAYPLELMWKFYLLDEMFYNSNNNNSNNNLLVEFQIHSFFCAW